MSTVSGNNAAERVRSYLQARAQDPPEDIFAAQGLIARHGAHYLTEADLKALLQTVPDKNYLTNPRALPTHLGASVLPFRDAAARFRRTCPHPAAGPGRGQGLPGLHVLRAVDVHHHILHGIPAVGVRTPPRTPRARGREHPRMKAAKRIHAYLDARSTALRGADRQDIASVQNGGEYTQYLRQKDLRKVLRSRDRLVEELKLSHAAQETTQRLLESNIRIYAQQLNLPASAATAADVLTGIKREQAAVESAREQRTQQTEEISRRFHDYRQDVDRYQKDLCRALYLPLTSSAEAIKQEVQRLRNNADTGEKQQNRMLDDTFSQIRTLYAELGGDPGVLPVSSRDEPIVMSRGQAWQLLRRAKTEHPGVQAISEARAYQKRVHPPQENKRRELLAAAIALVSGVSALYPFGEDSWEGIRRWDGRKAQLAHAGACIAALIDLLPSGNVPLQEAARQERRIVRDRAAYPGEEGDLW